MKKVVIVFLAIVIVSLAVALVATASLRDQGAPSAERLGTWQVALEGGDPSGGSSGSGGDPGSSGEGGTPDPDG